MTGPAECQFVPVSRDARPGQDLTSVLHIDRRSQMRLGEGGRRPPHLSRTSGDILALRSHTALPWGPSEGRNHRSWWPSSRSRPPLATGQARGVTSESFREAGRGAPITDIHANTICRTVKSPYPVFFLDCHFLHISVKTALSLKPSFRVIIPSLVNTKEGTFLESNNRIVSKLHPIINSYFDRG